MQKIILILFTAFVIILSSCSGGKNITESIDSGTSFYESGNYQEALTELETVIEYYKNEGKENECPVYARASAAANQLGQTEKAIQYLKSDLYTPYKNAESYYNLAMLYREIDNLTKEMEMLEAYVAEYPDGEQIDIVKTRLFDINAEIGNWETVIQMYADLSQDAQHEIKNLETLFTANEKLKNDDACDEVALRLLELDPENIMALEWMAKKLFWQAEKRYQKELKDYDQNKTNKQYKILLSALEEVSDDFTAALDKFLILYTQTPDPAYAKYLGDIYNRLDNKKKADHYYKLSKGND